MRRCGERATFATPEAAVIRFATLAGFAAEPSGAGGVFPEGSVPCHPFTTPTRVLPLPTEPDATHPRSSHPGAILRALTALLAAAVLAAANAATAASGASPAAIEVATGVYMVPGATGEVDPENRGRVGNAGFIVGDLGVIAIDTGTSYRHGVALLEAIGKVTSKPVRLVLITHTRQEFLFGAMAYRQRGIPIHMHRKAALLMAARCENCLKNLKRTLGEDEMRGTAMFKPDREFEEPLVLDAAGRQVRVLYHGHSSGPGDIAVLDVQTGVLFAGGLLDFERIPDVQDSDLKGWRQALGALREIGARTVVPGHGPAAPAPQVIDAVGRYLNQIEARLQELLQGGVALSAVADRTVLPEFESWDQYDTVHRRNASIVFLRLERDQVFK